MPTIKHEPRSGSPGGYEGDLSFTREQVTKLADLADADPKEIKGPLQEAAAVIGRFQYTLDVPSPGEQRASLEHALISADVLSVALTSLTPTDHGALRKRYAGGLVAEDISAADVAARNSEANAKLNADIAAVSRLRENLGVAFKLTGVRKGRPKERLKPFAEEKLGEVYDRFTTARSRRAHWREQFIQAAIGMLEILPVQGG